jgi:hypothetical protein
MWVASLRSAHVMLFRFARVALIFFYRQMFTLVITNRKRVYLTLECSLAARNTIFLFFFTEVERNCCAQEKWQRQQDAALADAIKAAAEVKDSKSDAAKDLQARVKLLEVRFSICHFLFFIFQMCRFHFVEILSGQSVMKTLRIRPLFSSGEEISSVPFFFFHVFTTIRKNIVRALQQNQIRTCKACRTTQRSIQTRAQCCTAWCGTTALCTVRQLTPRTF